MPPSKKAPDAAPGRRSVPNARSTADAELADAPLLPSRSAAPRGGRRALPLDAANAPRYPEPRVVRIPKYPEADMDVPPRAVRIPRYAEADPDAPPRAGRLARHSEADMDVPPRAVRIPKYAEAEADMDVPPRARRIAKYAEAEADMDVPPRVGRIAKYSDADMDAPASTKSRAGRIAKSPDAAPDSPSSTKLRVGRSAKPRRGAASASASSPALRGSPARSLRKRAAAGKGVRSARRGALVPTEAGLIWALLYDLLCAPFWLVNILRGRAKLSDGLRPLDRLLQFALSARMTALLITLNLLVFAFEIYTRHAGWSRAAFVAHFALSTDGLGRGEHLPLITHFFAHASLMHLGGNMLALFVFGRVVERNLGPWRLLACYLLAAVCSTALSLLTEGLSGRSVPTLGASGAVAGLVALGILLEPLTITFEALVPMPLFLVGWLAIAADFAALLGPGGAADPVDHPAHLGGYLSVLLGYYALKRQHQAQARLGLLINVATLVLMAGLWLFWGSR